MILEQAGDGKADRVILAQHLGDTVPHRGHPGGATAKDGECRFQNGNPARPARRNCSASPAI